MKKKIRYKTKFLRYYQGQPLVFPPPIPKEINKNTRYYSINQSSKSMNPEGDWIGGAVAHPPQTRKIWIRGHAGVERDNLSKLN